jgi:two-component system, OmpR family, phosphate regulon response regulator PhoB
MSRSRPTFVTTRPQIRRIHAPAPDAVIAPPRVHPAPRFEAFRRSHADTCLGSRNIGIVKKRILVADDEADVLTLLDTRLTASGYEVLRASDGIAALGRARNEDPVLAVLDVMMPGMSGLEVCRALKADPKTSRMPIILLTARNEEVDRVLGFEFGADDYVLKPFSPRELTLRIEALLRRQLSPVSAPATVLTVGCVSIERLAHRVTVHRKQVDLTRTEFKLLSILMEHAGRVLTRESLLDLVWPAEASIEIRTVDTHLRRLREKLGAGGRLIQTIRGFGYRIDEAVV